MDQQEFWRRVVTIPELGRSRYVVPVFAVAGAAAIVLLPDLGKGAIAVPFFAVLISVWYGGFGPGMFATALTAIVAVGISAYRGSQFPAWQILQLVLFIAGGVLITLLVEGLHAARRRVEESQRWLTAVLTSIGDAVIATDATGRITFSNPVARDLTGWEQDEAKGKPLDEVFRLASSGLHPAEVDPRESSAVLAAEEARLIARDGSVRPIAETSAPIGGVGGTVLVFRDVSERKRAEDDLKDADRRKDEFLAMLAHELRNPLSAMSNAVQLAKQTGWQGSDAWTQEVLERQVRHLVRLIDDLLDVSRVSRGNIQLRNEVIELASVLKSAVETVRPLTNERQHRLDMSYPAEGLRVEGDPTRLEQVLVNLLTNAAKYTESGGLIALNATREGKTIVIRVRDTGIGIAPDLLPKMFELFTQGDRSLARSEGGLGIGLTLVRSLTELHGGSVSAESAGRGRGSEFTVRLPATDRPLERPRPRPIASRPDGTYRILVIDDNEDTARALSRLLKLLGHDVRTAFDGPTALENARPFRPEFVLLDIGLPGIDGYEVARRLRDEGHSDAVIIAVSGYGRDEDRERSRAAGFNYHLVKPVDHDTLMQLISSGNASTS